MSETEAEAEETEAGSTETEERSPDSLYRRLTHRLSQWKWKQHKDLGVLGIGVVLSGISTVVGLVHVSWVWLFIFGCAITAVASLATAAIQERKSKDGLHRLWQAFAVLVALGVGLFCYHAWLDPANQPSAYSNGYQVMVNGSEVQIFPVYDQPGGSQTYEYSPLNSDEPVSLVCTVSLPTSGSWYEVYGDHGWIPRDAVHAIPGTTFPNVPHC